MKGRGEAAYLVSKSLSLTLINWKAKLATFEHSYPTGRYLLGQVIKVVISRNET